MCVVAKEATAFDLATNSRLIQLGTIDEVISWL